MKREIKIPAMGESVTEATIGRFLKPSGSEVQENEEIVELETEKVNQVLYAPASGQIQWNVSEGDNVKIGDVIGFIEEGAVKKEKKPEKKEAAPAPAKPAPPPVPKAAPAPEARPSAASARIREKEFVAELKKTPAPSKPAERPLPKEEELRTVERTDGRETRKKISRIRKVIASRLVEVLHSTAMLTTFNEVDMSAIIELRTRYKDSFQKAHGVKLGFMSFFVKAVVEGLKAIPQVNSYIDGEEIVERHYYDIGIAVGTDRGLVVPVVRGCERLSFAEIEKEIDAYAKKAREGRLTIDDMEGGGFTITNGGVYGSLLSTPILNPPQSGILGMHKIEKRPVVIDDQIVIRPMMYLAMSYDHRVIDGKEAVTFLVRVKEVLEDPERLLFFDAQV